MCSAALAVAEATGAHPRPIHEGATQVRGILYRAVLRFHTRSGLPAGLTCLVAAYATLGRFVPFVPVAYPETGRMRLTPRLCWASAALASSARTS